MLILISKIKTKNYYKISYYSEALGMRIDVYHN